MSQTSQVPTPTALINKHILPNVDILDWVGPKNGEDSYSPNQVIGAYRAGYTSGIESAFQAGQDWINQVREKNAELAGAHTRLLLEWLQERGFHPTRAILNQSIFDSPEVLIFLPVDEYVSDNFDGIYSLIREFEEKWSDSQYRLRYTITDEGPEVNDDLLAADGYILHHTFLQKI